MEQLPLFPSPKPTPTKTRSNKRQTQPRPQHVRVGRFFTLLDFLVSDTALRYGLINWCDWHSDRGREIITNAELLCSLLLDPLCEEFGRISVTRGYLGEEVFRWIYPKAEAADWPKGALYHGFASNQGGADVLVHSWQGTALDLALHIQRSPQYTFDVIRVYPESPILCMGVERGKNARLVMQWKPNFRGVDRYPFKP